MLYNALKVLNALPKETSVRNISDYTDSGRVSSWAIEAMTVLLDTGTITGSNGKLCPTAAITRAELAQVLYSLLGK